MRRTSISISLLLLLLLAPGCKTSEDPSGTAEGSDSEDSSGTADTGDDELPEGWEDAQAIELTQAPASNGCEDWDSMSLELGLVEGRVQAVIDGLVIGCGEGYEGFVRAGEGGGYELLVQPINMNPPGLAGCVCANRMRGVLGVGELGTGVEVFQRPSFEEDPSGTLNSLGTATIEDMAPGCADLVPCDSDNPCSNEGNEDPAEYWDHCVSLAGCGGPVCVSHEEACMIDCGTPDCAILESEPEGVSCE